MDAKDAVIEKVYTDPEGFGSVADTLKAARKLDPSITREDVKEWIAANYEKKDNLARENSWIPPGPHYEYQIDLFFMADLKGEEQKRYAGAMCAIDSFTKFVAVEPMKTKMEHAFLSALVDCFKTLGGSPKSIYADDEGAWHGKTAEKLLKTAAIQLINTRSHAGIVERVIRTLKSMMYRRLERNPELVWHGELLRSVVDTYNRKRVHSTVEMTPEEAGKPGNEKEVRANIMRHGSWTRDYPEVKVGDVVRVYRKKKPMDKQQVSMWLPAHYTVTGIEVVNGQNFYTTTWNDKRPLLRHDILKIPPKRGANK